MDQWKGKIAVVTGASSGIGAAITKDLAKTGITVIGLARRSQRVEDLKKDLGIYAKNLHAFHCDVADEKSVKTAFKWIEEKFGGVNILINNAGIARNKLLLTEDDSNDDIHEVIGTNLLGVLYCTREAYKQLKKYDAIGYIVNINSIDGHGVSFYPATEPLHAGTKHAITATTEVIRQELIYLQNKKVRVTSISPGLVETEILKASNMENCFDLNTVVILQPNDISNAILYVLSTPIHVNVKEIIIKPTGETF